MCLFFFVSLSIAIIVALKSLSPNLGTGHLQVGLFCLSLLLRVGLIFLFLRSIGLGCAVPFFQDEDTLQCKPPFGCSLVPLDSSFYTFSSL